MGRRTKHVVTYVAATFAAVGCLYGCADAPQGASQNSMARPADGAGHDHISASGTGVADSTSSYRLVSVTLPGRAGPTVTTRSRSVIAEAEALLRGLPAAPARPRACPAITVIYQVTLEPAQSGQPEVVVSTSSCDVDHVSVGSRPQPALWDQGGKMYLLARALLGPEMKRLGWVSPPPPISCHVPRTETTHGSVPCQAKPSLAPLIPD